MEQSWLTLRRRSSLTSLRLTVSFLHLGSCSWKLDKMPSFTAWANLDLAASFLV